MPPPAPARVASLCLALLFAASVAAAAPLWQVRGFSLFGDRELSRMDAVLMTGEAPSAHYTPSFVENLLTLLHARVQRDGYLAASYQIDLTLSDGTALAQPWDGKAWLSLPEDAAYSAVRVTVQRGVLHHYRSVTFDGLQALAANEAVPYFYPRPFVLSWRGWRVFSPVGMADAAANLREALRRQGFANAVVTARITAIDPPSGAVDVAVSVIEGPRHRITRIRESWLDRSLDNDLRPRDFVPHDMLFHQDRVSDQIRLSLNRLYALGHAQARVVPELQFEEAPNGERHALLRLNITPGPRLVLGSVRVEGADDVRPSVINRRLQLQPGSELDPLALEAARLRLSRLGIFRRIDVVEEPVAARSAARDLLFIVQPGSRMEVNLLFAASSYEWLKGGIEVQRANLWGRAHSDRLLLSQSFKSTVAHYQYRMPELFGEDISLVVESSYLWREEYSFDRKETGAEVRVFKEFSNRSQASVAWRLEDLRAEGLDPDASRLTRERTRAGTLRVAWQRDTRDNPLYPTRGHQMRFEAEVGDPLLGSDVRYQKLLLLYGVSLPVGERAVCHLRAFHGTGFTLGSSDDNLPIGKRFFPGGPHSIRGFRQGAASPVNDTGQRIGAETYTLIQVEWEQLLAPKLSAVLFSDHLWMAAQNEAFPGDEYLHSLGVGVRYRTIIGPLRLEAGFNPDPRPVDPRWAIQLSIGYPF
jgi:outer membrane protein insertion porin family